MSSRLEFSEAAAADVLEARLWYESKGVGLSSRFLDEVQSCCDAIKRFPLGFGLIHGEYRGVCLKRFPYVVVYVTESDMIEVVALMHTSLSSETWRERFNP